MPNQRGLYVQSSLTCSCRFTSFQSLNFSLFVEVMSNDGTTTSVQRLNVMQTTTFKDAARNANRHSRMEAIVICSSSKQAPQLLEKGLRVFNMFQPGIHSHLRHPKIAHSQLPTLKWNPTALSDMSDGRFSSPFLFNTGNLYTNM